MSEQELFKLTGPITGSMADMGATPEQREVFAASVGGLCGPLVLTASELAERLESLPQECGGRGFAVALRMLDPGTKLQVTSDGPVELKQGGRAVKHTEAIDIWHDHTSRWGYRPDTPAPLTDVLRARSELIEDDGEWFQKDDGEVMAEAAKRSRPCRTLRRHSSTTCAAGIRARSCGAHT